MIKSKTLIGIVLYGGVGIYAIVFAMRQIIFSGFRLLPGDFGDARLIAFLTSHWRMVFTGQADWLSPIMFYPLTGHLGYTDTVVLFGLPHALLGSVGVSSFTSIQIMLIVFAGIGFAFTAILLRQRFALPHWACALGGALFTTANNIYLKGGHLQMYAVYLVPLFLYWISGLAIALRAGDRGALMRNGICLSIGLPVLMYHSFYIAWFLAFLALLYMAVLAWRTPLAAIRVWLVETGCRHGRDLLKLAAIFVLSLIPFLVTYMPVVMEFGGRPSGEVKFYQPKAIDILNVGRENLLWGRAVKHYIPIEGRNVGEVWTGFGLFTLFTFLVSLFFLRRSNRLGEPKEAAERFIEEKRQSSGLDIAVMGVAVLVCWVLVFNIDGIFLWKYVHRLVPGASAIRAVGRIQLLVNLPVIIIGLCGLVRLVTYARTVAKSSTKWILFALVGLLCVGLLAEQYNLRNHSSLDVVDTWRETMAFPPPPAQCQVFYVAPPFPKNRLPWWKIQIDALMLAQRFGVPTVNGYNGQFPKGWGLMNVYAHNYESKVADWLLANGVKKTVCALKMGDKVWRIKS
ncbi:MAG: hypothetical protein IID17_14665 [Nitrospinae bacterium]|nr:hypothetical protein [Nitrospinota bacterium]